MDPGTRKFYFQTQSSTVAERNIFVTGKDIHSIDRGASRAVLANRFRFVGHPRGGDAVVQTYNDTTPQADKGVIATTIHLPELSTTTDLDRIGTSLVLGLDPRIESLYTIAQLNHVRNRVEGDGVSPGAIRVWHSDGGVNTLLDYILHKVIYRFGSRNMRQMNIVEGSPDLSAPRDYGITAELHLGGVPQQFAELLALMEEGTAAAQQNTNRLQVPVVVSGGGTNIPSSRRWDGNLVWDPDADVIQVGGPGGVIINLPSEEGTNDFTGANTIRRAGVPLTIQNTTNAASNQVLDAQGGDRATATNNDESYFSFKLEDSSGVQSEFFRLTWIADDVSSSSKDGRARLSAMKADTLTRILDFIGTGVVDFVAGANVTVDGSNIKHTMSVPASAMKGTATTGAGDTNKLSESRELATNDINVHYIAFDQTTAETAFFQVAAPDNWDGSTITFKVYWTAASGSGGVAFDLQGRSFADDEALDQAQGTKQTVTDTLITADDVHVTAVSSALTLGGTPAGGELLNFELTRDTAHASDTLTADAQVLAVAIEFGVNALTA